MTKEKINRHLFLGWSRKKVSTFLTMAIFLGVLNPSAQAAASPALIYQNTDISAVVHQYKKSVFTLNKTINVYSWSITGVNGDAPETLSQAKSGALSFWGNFGRDSGGNMVGYGLYAAIDPIVSQSFGGSINWRVLNMELPTGSVILDLNLSGRDIRSGIGKPTDDEKKQIDKTLETFKCPVWNDLYDYFSKAAQLDTACQGLFRKIFQDHFKIDAFAYPYSSTAFKTCSGMGGAENSAFVITRNEWMTSKNTHYFTKDSTKLIEKRILIQTLFLGTNENALILAPESKSRITSHIREFPDAELMGAKTTCEEYYCELTARFCTGEKNCADIFLGRFNRPGGPLITQKEAERFGSHRSSLLWLDLEGKPKIKSVKEWLLSSRYVCDGKYPYNERQEQGQP